MRNKILKYFILAVFALQFTPAFSAAADPDPDPASDCGQEERYFADEKTGEIISNESDKDDEKTYFKVETLDDLMKAIEFYSEAFALQEAYSFEGDSSLFAELIRHQLTAEERGIILLTAQESDSTKPLEIYKGLFGLRLNDPVLPLNYKRSTLIKPITRF